MNTFRISVQNRDFTTPKRLLAAVLVTLAVPLAAQAADFMTQEQLLATIPGATVNATSKDGVKWAQSYSAYKAGKKQGAISGIWNGKKYKAKWYVKANQWCENWGDGQACWDLEKVDAKSLRIYENGKAKPNLWHLN